MLVTKITTYVDDGLQLLGQQYKGRPLLAGLLTTWLTGMQELEDAIYPLDSGRQVLNAIGAQLDGIGQIVGISRNGLSDAQYLLFIFGKIAENNSDTTINTVLTVVQFLFQGDKVFLQEYYPAGVAIQVVGVTLPSNLLQTAKNLVQMTFGAGIDLVFMAEYPTDNVFRFAGPGVIGSTNGFADPSIPGSGGVWVNLI